jgi:hypothetical protein
MKKKETHCANLQRSTSRKEKKVMLFAAIGEDGGSMRTKYKVVESCCGQMIQRGAKQTA